MARLCILPINMHLAEWQQAPPLLCISTTSLCLYIMPAIPHRADIPQLASQSHQLLSLQSFDYHHFFQKLLHQSHQQLRGLLLHQRIMPAVRSSTRPTSRNWRMTEGGVRTSTSLPLITPSIRPCTASRKVLGSPIQGTVIRTPAVAG